MDRNDIVIVGAARTAIGGFQGELKDKSAPELGAAAIAAALHRAGLPAAEGGEGFMGCVLPAGVGRGRPRARRASTLAGVPQAVGCTTINKMCGSGMKAMMLGHDLIAAG